jgi:outer membrane immunogenic protein
MKKFVSAAAVALALFTGSALAADLPSHKAPPVYVPPPPPPLWTGFYVGINLGGGWTSNTVDNNNWALFGLPGFPVGPAGLPLGFGAWNGANNSNRGGVVGGGQIGYNFQFANSFVAGVETDFQGTSIGSGSGGSNAWGGWWLGTGNAGPQLPWFGTVRGRLGFLFTPTFLVYGTAGFAYGEVKFPFLGFSNVRSGWTAGGGVEWMFLPNWSAKLEYLFVDLSSGGAVGTFGWNWGSHHHPEINVVRAGLNYHFNLFSPAPVVAKY